MFFSLACSCLGLVQKSLSHDKAGGVVGGGRFTQPYYGLNGKDPPKRDTSFTLQIFEW